MIPLLGPPRVHIPEVLLDPAGFLGCIYFLLAHCGRCGFTLKAESTNNQNLRFVQESDVQYLVLFGDSVGPPMFSGLH